MHPKGAAQRDAIVQAANRQFYEHGYGQTSFSDIAKAARFNRGNFYHYFKTKDAILAAVVEARKARIAAQLTEWEDANPNPRDRLKRLARMLVHDGADVARFGCPMGTLSAELAKGDKASLEGVRAMFDQFIDWAAAQFAALGAGADAPDHARRLLARMQGVALLSHLYGDAAFLTRESDAIADDIDHWRP